MAYKLLISDRAHEQLDSIIEYVAVKLSNPTAAAAILSDIEDVYDRLTEMPESMPLCDDPFLAFRNYRKALLSKHDYIVLFRIDADIVRVAGIFHTMENYANKI